ncbi:MAG: pantetheine-phosphate adenylyltransferase [Planctomycetia bacterium]|nr:pantetheine-phosphate adenylyltransferase [Planctomycetia bacterium]
MPQSDPRIAVYTGSFDPITLGHLNVIERGSRLVDKLIVGVGINVVKSPLFTPQERVDLVRRVTERLGNVEVREFTGLSVKFVRSCQARVMIRGVRPLTDIAAEITMMMANRQLDPGIETVFLMADSEYAHVSSSLIKQIAPLASDEALTRFVPREVVEALRQKRLPSAGDGPDTE